MDVVIKLMQIYPHLDITIESSALGLGGNPRVLHECRRGDKTDGLVPVSHSKQQGAMKEQMPPDLTRMALHCRDNKSTEILSESACR